MKGLCPRHRMTQTPFFHDAVLEVFKVIHETLVPLLQYLGTPGELRGEVNRPNHWQVPPRSSASSYLSWTPWPPREHCAVLGVDPSCSPPHHLLWWEQLSNCHIWLLQQHLHPSGPIRNIWPDLLSNLYLLQLSSSYMFVPEAKVQNKNEKCTTLAHSFFILLSVIADFCLNL